MIKPVGKKLVVEMEPFVESRYGDIIIPCKVKESISAVNGTILSMAPEAAEKTGLKVGDVIIYDRLSVYDDKQTYGILNYDNVVARVNEDGSLTAPGDCVLTLQIVKNEEGGVILPETFQREPKTYEIQSFGLTFENDLDLEIGDMVIKDPNQHDFITFTYTKHKKVYIIIEKKILIGIVKKGDL